MYTSPMPRSSRVLSMVLLACCLAPLTSRAQAFGPYAVGWQPVEVVRPDNTQFTALVVYPAVHVGEGAAVQRGDAPYPGLVFAHGYELGAELYTDTYAYYASHGYVVIAPFSGMGDLPKILAYVADIRHCITYLEVENTRSDSPFYGAVDPQAFGVTGHSMGGGSCIMAAADDHRIKAASVWAPARLVAIMDYVPRVTVPCQIVAGSGDTVTPLLNEPYPIFSALAGPRQIAVILRGWHYAFLDDRVSPGFQRGFSLPPGIQIRLAREMTREFFDLQLKRDESRWSKVWGPEQQFREGVIAVIRPGLELERYVQFKTLNTDGTARYALAVRNETDHTTSVDLLTDPGGAVTEIRPATLTLAPNEIGWVVATVRAADQSATEAAIGVLSVRNSSLGVVRDYALLVALPPTDAQ